MEWLPFDLHPEYPDEGIGREELDARYGGERWREGLRRTFAEAGLPASPDIERVPRSLNALRVGELARDRARLAELHPRLFDAYWARARDIGDDEVLVEEATACGIDEGEVREVLGSDRYHDRVQAETARALELGVTGVPAWVVDGRLLVPGAQPHELFERVLERLGHAPAA